MTDKNEPKSDIIKDTQIKKPTPVRHHIAPPNQNSKSKFNQKGFAGSRTVIRKSLSGKS